MGNGYDGPRKGAWDHETIVINCVQWDEIQEMRKSGGEIPEEERSASNSVKTLGKVRGEQRCSERKLIGIEETPSPMRSERR
jgi:hypothetical protein